MTVYKPNDHLRKQLPFSISRQIAKRSQHVNDGIVYLQREARESQFDAHKDTNGTFSVESILIIGDALLMWASLVRSVEQKQRVNHTRCCFLFERNSLSLAPLPRPSEVRWTVSRGWEMDCCSGWLKFRQTIKVCHGYSLLDDGLEIPNGACYR